LTPDEAADRAIDEDGRLDGEDPNTRHTDDAVHWIKVYQELLAFKEDLLSRTDHVVNDMREADAQTDAVTDVVLLGTQADRYRRRLQEWTARAEELKNLHRSDPGGRTSAP